MRLEAEHGPNGGQDDRPRRGPVRTVMHDLGELMLTIGLALLLFVAYETWGKLDEIADGQSLLVEQLDTKWRTAEPASPSPPETVKEQEHEQQQEQQQEQQRPLVRLYLPRLALNWVVVEGVRLRDLRHAPGHYPDSALPGELGNFAVAGHRSRGLFWNLDRMREGDPVVVEAAEQWFVYRVYRVHIVSPAATYVVASSPEDPQAAPNRSLLTLTTCDPKWDNNLRLVVHAELERTQSKTFGRPIELGD